MVAVPPTALLALATWLAVTDTGGYPARHPATTVGLAALAGILLGALAGWRLGRDTTTRRPATSPNAANRYGTSEHLTSANRKLAVAGDELDTAHRELAAALAANAELRDELARRDVVRVERWRLAREVHETLAQHLSAIGAQLEAALAGRRGWAQRVTLARELARQGLVEARRSAQALTLPPPDGNAPSEAPTGPADTWHVRTAEYTVDGEAAESTVDRGAGPQPGG